MGSFNSIYRGLFKADASHAWIALHRCVECNAYLTGENFNSIFKRLESKFKFKREIRAKWPTLSQIHSAARKLKVERDEWFSKMSPWIEERRQEKKRGIRISKNREFLELAWRQTNYVRPRLDFWGWRKIREEREGERDHSHA